jgi:hypothetical protein
LYSFSQATEALFLFQPELVCGKDSQEEEIKEMTPTDYFQDILLSTKSKVQKNMYGIRPFV